MSIQELIQYIQSANINFMIGSGASKPYLATLGSVETWLTKLAEDKKASSNASEYIVVEASIYKTFYESVIRPNHCPCGDLYEKTKENYKALLSAWNGIMNKRYSRLLNKQVNLFSTNVDLMIEQAASGIGVELNDGFKGSVEQLYDESNFMRSVSQNSLHFQYTSEIPIFNLLKIHGSINWEQTGNNGVRNNTFWYHNIDEAIRKIDANQFVQVNYEDEGGKIKEKTYEQLVNEACSLKIKDTSIYTPFLEAYNKLVIVNPTKRKFEQTVMDYHFYELMRIYANALEKENAILFAAGFSFADEHIASITKRAADRNPTLQIVIFAFSNDEEDSFKTKLNVNSLCLNNNITIITPEKFINDNQDDRTKEFAKSISRFDMESIARVFSYIESQIHGSDE